LKTLDITLELSNICNFKCDMCFLREKDIIKGQFLKKQYIDKFIKELEKSDYRIHVLKTFWAGEGMLHPEFKNIIEEFCNNKKIDIIAFDSNASVMDLDISEFLVKMSEKKDLRIIISLDAIDENTYSKIRKGGIFENTLFNIRNLIKCKKNSDNSKLKIMIQFIVHPQNYLSLSDFILFWKKEFLPELDFNIYLNQSIAHGNGVNIRPLTIQDTSMNISQLEANDLFEKALKDSGIIKKNEIIHGFSQGGGIINIISGQKI